MTRDLTTSHPDDAAKADRGSAYEVDDRDYDIDDGVTREPQHDHRPGLYCLTCALEKSVAKFKAALVEAGDEHFVCDDCQKLYDLGCPHGFWLCDECMGRCPECRDDAAQTALADWKDGPA